MIDKVHVGFFYKSASGAAFHVSALGRHAQSCETIMVVYTNVTPTLDFPIGVTWVLDREIFKKRMVQMTKEEIRRIYDGSYTCHVPDFDRNTMCAYVRTLKTEDECVKEPH